MLVETHQWRLDTVVLQQFFGVAGIFGGDEVYGLERLQRAQRDVPQIANRRGDHIQHACHRATPRA
jgi:hypothetical protein